MDERLVSIKKKFDEVCGEGVFEVALEEANLRAVESGWVPEERLLVILQIVENNAADFLLVSFLWAEAKCKTTDFWLTCHEALEEAYGSLCS